VEYGVVALNPWKRRDDDWRRIEKRDDVGRGEQRCYQCGKTVQFVQSSPTDGQMVCHYYCNLPACPKIVLIKPISLIVCVSGYS
jgi:hypothetical protein